MTDLGNLVMYLLGGLVEFLTAVDLKQESRHSRADVLTHLAKLVYISIAEK